MKIAPPLYRQAVAVKACQAGGLRSGQVDHATYAQIPQNLSADTVFTNGRGRIGGH